MKNTLKLTVLFTIVVLNIFAQNVTITPNGITPLQGGSGNSFPKLSYDNILALPSPQIGDMAIDITFNCLRFFNGTRWVFFLTSDEFAQSAIKGTLTATGSSTASAYGNSIAIDSIGNLYISGVYSGTATFGTTSITSVGNNDVYVAKFNADGTFAWVRTAGGSLNEGCNGIAIDKSGNLIITGYFNGNMVVNNTSLTSSGFEDIYLIKYSTAGAFVWARKAGGASINDIGKSIVTDSNGSIYLTGSYSGNVSFAGGPFNVGPALNSVTGSTDIFIAKYLANGSCVQAASAGGNSSENGISIDIDSLGKIYVTGTFGATATFGANSIVSAGDKDIFVAKYDFTTNTWVWVNKAGGLAYDFPNSIKVSHSGGVIVVGSFDRVSTFSPSIILTSFGSADAFIANYGTTSGNLIYARSAGGVGYDVVQGVDIDKSGNIYITGTFSYSASFGGINLISSGNEDIFVAKYNKFGTIQWALKAGGTGIDEANSIAINASGKIYIVGSIFNKSTFGNNTLQSTGLSDVFFARISE
jgi:hypothetical protein